MIPVTKPFLPPKSEYIAAIDAIWDRCWLTNNGPYVNDLELKLKEYLGIDHLLFTTNGTVALQMVLKALGRTGQIVTTPFSYVATTSSIVWEGCKPVFADIDKHTLNIDPANVENAMNGDTIAILATHVYGIPCDVDALERIGKKHGIPVIYDAAHAFGTMYKGRSLASYGDMSILSTHATKLFHTIEGGAVIAKNPDTLKQLAYLRNFGHDGPEKFALCGINGKNSEPHAAMGVVNLPYVKKIIGKRKTDSERYDGWLIGKGLDITRPQVPAQTSYNHAYYPIVFASEADCLKVLKNLADHEVFARRYFYPSLSGLNYVDSNSTPVCDDIAKRVLCLPHYYDLSIQEIDMISRLVIRSLKY